MKRYRRSRGQIKKTLSPAVVTVSVLLLGSMFGSDAAMAGEQGDRQTRSDSQQIYLDPDTGEIIDHPPPPSPAADPKTPAAPHQEQPNRKATTGERAWETKDGVQMLTPDARAMPKSHAVHCSDGSLRIGEAKVAQDEREALCAGKND